MYRCCTLLGEGGGEGEGEQGEAEGVMAVQVEARHAPFEGLVARIGPHDEESQEDAEGVAETSDELRLMLAESDLGGWVEVPAKLREGWWKVGGSSSKVEDAHDARRRMVEAHGTLVAAPRRRWLTWTQPCPRTIPT